MKLVCAQRGVDCCEPRAQYDDEGRPFFTWTGVLAVINWTFISWVTKSRGRTLIS
jgi:hypothetical protein